MYKKDELSRVVFDNHKDKFVGRGCNNALPNTLGHYVAFGNYCRQCNAKVNSSMAHARQLRFALVQAGVLKDY